MVSRENLAADADIIDRARQALTDYEWAKTCRVAVVPERAYRLLAELVDEVERLRGEAERLVYRRKGKGKP